jgi:hypothetical protein
VEHDYPKFDPPTTRFVRIYVFVQFWLLTFASLWLLKAQPSLPRVFVLAMFVWLCGSLYVQGTWLEGRSSARWLEWLRLAAAFTLATLAFLVWPARANVALVLASYASLSAVVLALEHLKPATRLTTA